MKDEEIREHTFDEVYKQYKYLIYNRLERWNISFYNDMFDKDDFIQLALLGLWKAYKTYDYFKGCKFLTHATRKIDGELQHHHRAYSKMLKGNEAQVKCVMSLNSVVNDDGESPRTLEEIIPDGEHTEDEFAMSAELHRAVRKLKPKVREAIYQYYYQDRGTPEIGRMFHYSATYARMLIDNGVNRMRLYMA